MNSTKASFQVTALLLSSASIFVQANSVVLLTTIITPTPSNFGLFGGAVAAMGNDRGIISGLANVNYPPPFPGGVYLFTTNGISLATFINPTPAAYDNFGWSAATVRSSCVIIGAYPEHADA